MIEGIPRISVLIICYKQEELIKRAINSLLAQKDYIYEICVSDDCSPDRTWEVLQEYDRQYPGLFKLHRNEPNVGIFENIEYTWTMPTGDLIYRLAGDDECGEGWFKTVVEYIQKKKIDYKNEIFCIYGDYKAIYPNGDSFIRRNNLVKKEVSPLTLSIRNVIANRSSCYSINVLKKFVKVSQGRSHIAESAQDFQLQMFTKKNYYISQVGNIYYAAIGVCTNKSNSQRIEREQITPYLLDFIKKQGIEIDHKDYLFLTELQPLLFSLRQHFSFIAAFRAIRYEIVCYNKAIGIRSFDFKRVLFAIRRKMPHRHPISQYV